MFPAVLMTRTMESTGRLSSTPKITIIDVKDQSTESHVDSFKTVLAYTHSLVNPNY